jgi:phosphoglycolate phosphatase-like HAD superfamily hydrolase
MNDLKAVYVFDLDGTICNTSHRKQYVQTKPKNWDAWNAGLVNDKPNNAVIEVLHSLFHMGFGILLVSGRSEDYREQTKEWLEKYDVFYDELYMRKSKDLRADDIIKDEIADVLQNNYNIMGVFDDRKRVVDMWIKRGIFVFDVGQGAGDF